MTCPRILIALAAALCALAALAPVSLAEPPLPMPGYYDAVLGSRNTTVSWKVREVAPNHRVWRVQECSNAPLSTHECDYGKGYLWEDSTSGVWHVRLKFFGGDFQVDGHWNRHGGGLMCYLHGHGERQHTHLNCSPHAYGFSWQRGLDPGDVE